MRLFIPLLLLTLAGCSGRAAPQSLSDFRHRNPYAHLDATHLHEDGTRTQFWRDSFPRISANGHYETEKRLHVLRIEGETLVAYAMEFEQ